MCGISGNINFSEGDMIKSTLSQTHRGPDNTAFVSHLNYHTGHNRLSIIDLSPNGNQPIFTDRYILTYNGEIYNYQSLGFHGNDARVLLHYIEAFGLDRALQDINGMYAFALYDKLESKLHLVVDRLGQKPLYYYQDGERFAYASSPAALLHLKEKWKLNKNAVRKYFLLGSTWGEETFFEGIYKLCGAYHLTVGNKSITKKRYWEPKFQRDTRGIGDLVLDSIQKVKVSDVPVYIFLSGGIDSTLVASQFTGGHAIHLQSPEYKYAQQAADKFGIHLHEVKVKNVDFLELTRDYVRKTGECAMASPQVSLTASETSKYCKVAVTANGADELFCGYDRHFWDDIRQQRHIFRPDYEADLMDLMVKMYPVSGGISVKRWVEVMTYVQFDLNKTLDFASMCHSLEVRSPFLDHRLVEMALSIPESSHLGNFGHKNILKGMLSKIGFSGDYLTRPKLGFSVHYPDENFEKAKRSAYQWAREYFSDAGFNKRDERYTEAAALSFKIWMEVWSERLEGT